MQKLSKHIKQLEGDQERRNAQMVIVFPNKKSMAANRKSVNNSPKLEKDDNLWKWRSCPLSEASSWQIVKQVLSETYVISFKNFQLS